MQAILATTCRVRVAHQLFLLIPSARLTETLHIRQCGRTRNLNEEKPIRGFPGMIMSKAMSYRP